MGKTFENMKTMNQEISAASHSIQRLLQRNTRGQAKARETLELLKKAEFPLEQLGQQVNAALGPSESEVSSAPRVKEAFSAFWEASGVVLLNPTIPQPDSLVSRFIPALDKFLVASSINVKEEVDAEKDPRKFNFLAKIKKLHQTFHDEVISVVSLFRQFSDALAALLDSQRMVRPVSQDEHVLRATWMHDRFVRLLENLLSATTRTIISLQKSFLDAEASSVRAQRLAPIFVMKDDDIWRTQKQLNPNFAKAKSKIKRKPVERLVDDDWLNECEDSSDTTPRAMNAGSSMGAAPNSYYSLVKKEKEVSSYDTKMVKSERKSRKKPLVDDDGSSEVHQPTPPSVVMQTKKVCYSLDVKSSSTSTASNGMDGKTITRCPPPIQIQVPQFEFSSIEVSDNSFSFEEDPCFEIKSGPMDMVFGCPPVDGDNWYQDLDDLMV